MNTNIESHGHTASTAPGVIFTSCELIDGAQEQTPRYAAGPDGAGPAVKPATRRREVAVNGRRVKTIDVHAHCIVPEAMQAMGLDAADHHQPGIVLVPEDRIRVMDEQGIDVEALSINPFWYKAERDVAAEVVRLNNE
ncbi:MAG: hypothetical protein V4637_07945, partial [Pseudomonadota bacterium]